MGKERVIQEVVKRLNILNHFLIGGTEVTASADELNALHGNTATAAELSQLHGSTATPTELSLLHGVGALVAIAAEITLTETSGAGVYTGSVTLPAGATLLDVIVNGVALWNSQTSATLKVGDAGTDDGFFTGVDLKATDLLAGESLSLDQAGGKAGAYVANSQVSPRYAATTRVISAIVTKVGTSGTLGRTRVVVVYAVPASSIAATKV